MKLYIVFTHSPVQATVTRRNLFSHSGGRLLTTRIGRLDRFLIETGKDNSQQTTSELGV